MAQSPPDIPWWRVVGSDGSLPLGKRDPNMEFDQQRRLVMEGIEMLDGKIRMTDHAVSFEEVASWR